MLEFFVILIWAFCVFLCTPWGFNFSYWLVMWYDKMRHRNDF